MRKESHLEVEQPREVEGGDEVVTSARDSSNVDLATSGESLRRIES